jgi:hypothetical protein
MNTPAALDHRLALLNQEILDQINSTVGYESSASRAVAERLARYMAQRLDDHVEGACIRLMDSVDKLLRARLRHWIGNVQKHLPFVIMGKKTLDDEVENFMTRIDYDDRADMIHNVLSDPQRITQL